MTKFFCSSLALAVVLAQAAFGQTATTTPVGAMTYSFPATSTVTTTTMSVPLVATPAYVGKISSLTSNSVTVTSAGWTAGAFAGTAQPYFVRFTTGNQAGRMVKITANTADTLTLDTTDNSTQNTALDLSGWSVVAGSSGDQFEVVPGDTLATLFGDNSQNNPLVFVKGTSTLNADTIGLYNKSTGLWDTYFFHTTLNAWTLKGNATTSQNNVVINPENGFLITRRASRPATSIVVLGNVPSISPLTKTPGSVSSNYINSRFPVDVTLAALNLSGWIKGTSTLNSDTLSIYNTSTGLWDVYYQLSSNSEWRLKGNSTTDQSSKIIPAGTAIGFTKRGTISGSSSFLKTASLPYTL